MVHIVGITTVIFGLVSLFMVSRARSRLSEGAMRKYIDNFAVCLAFVVVFSVWQTVRSFYETGSIEFLYDHFDYLTYPEYIFLVFAYVAFIVASFRAYKISKEFGFKEDGKKIAQMIKDGSAMKTRGNIVKKPKKRK